MSKSNTCIKLLFILLVSLTPFLGASASDEVTVGKEELSPPQTYVIVEELSTKKKRLYKDKAFDEIKDKKDLRLVERLSIKSIEYRYRPVDKASGSTPEEFTILEITDGRAILIKDYIPEPGIKEEDEVLEIFEEETTEIIEELEEEQSQPTAKRLVSELFLKIEGKELSEHEWEIKLPSTLEAAANFGIVLGIITKKVSELLEPDKKSKIFFKTSIGKVMLGPDGITIESLNSRLRSLCGLKDDDIVKTINGKNVTTISDIAAVFSGLPLSSPHNVTLRLLRDDEELTHTYYVR